MRQQPHPLLKEARVRSGHMGSDDGYGNTGQFIFKRDGRTTLRVIASDGTDGNGGIDTPWEHVSISCENRTPKWDEMCWVKSLFWEVEECVIQFHPPESKYVNVHPHCLHLWKPLDFHVPTPPLWTLA